MSGDWPLVALSNLTVKVGSGATPKGGEKVYRPSGVPLIRSMNVVFFGFKHEGLVYVDDVHAQALKNVTVRAGDVLLNITGASIGRVTVAPEEMDGARVNQHVCIIRTLPDLDPHFLAAFLSTPDMQARIGSENYGVTRQALTKQQILEFAVPLPAIAEQRRIVVALNRVLRRIRNCRQRLQTIPQSLHSFREAVLEAAVSGRLTDEWRIEKRGSHSLDAWQSVTIGDVAEVGTGSTPLRSRSDFYAADGIPWITSASTAQPVVTSSTEFVTPAAIRAHRLRIYPKGTLLVAMYGEGKTRGQVTELGIDATINQACAAIRVNEERANPEFVRLILEAAYERMRKLAEGGNQPNLNLTKIKTFGIYLPPLDEQTQVVLRTRDLMGAIESLQRRCVSIRRLADKLTPALLAKAFRGQLVPQDTTAEPAGRMLARIRAGQKAVDVTGKREATVVVHGRGRRKISVREEKRGEGRARKRA